MKDIFRGKNKEEPAVVEKKTTGMDIAKAVIRFAVGGLVEIFIGAATNSIVSRVDGGRVAKLGAKAGGFLVGLMIGDQVSNYVCDTIDETMYEIEELKEAMDEEE